MSVFIHVCVYSCFTSLGMTGALFGSGGAVGDVLECLVVTERGFGDTRGLNWVTFVVM